MKPKAKQRKPRVELQLQSADVAMADVSGPKLKPRRAKKAPPKVNDKATRFKEEQHLKIETQELAEPDAEKAAPPSSTSKKRRRRSAAEIDRKFKCPVEDCPKASAYGSEGSLIHHQRVKHPELAEAEAQEKKEAQAQQAGTFSLPLHCAPRNVTIRPATPLVTFASAPSVLLRNQSSNAITELASPSDITPPSAKAARRNMRSRSNSEPVSHMEEVVTPLAAPMIPAPRSLPMKTRAKTPRKPRRAATPHPKKAAASTARRIKLRSKSESLPALPPFQPLEELKRPANHRSDSAASAHAAILPISSGSSGGRGSFEWPPSSVSASGHHSTSLSSDEQAIDSDILSVLANCDSDEIEDPAMLDFGGGPPSTSSYQSSASFAESEDAEMLPVGMECFKIAEHATLPTEDAQGFVMKEPESELGLKAFATLGDDWANALHLSNHLEKMSMAQSDSPPHILESTFGGVPDRDGAVGRLRSASDPVHVAAPMYPALDHFSSMSVEPFPSKTGVASNEPTGGNGLVGQQLEHNANFQQWFGSSRATEAAKVDGSDMQQMLWLSSEAGVARVENPQPTSAALDELLQHEDAVDWKVANSFEGEADVDYALGDSGATSLL
ncbi:hypothetical protein PHYPSEUDO_002345 [Phytophthora pseudosyringae]|uniref:C2H2-type domain-containing protein n=1 Tax=Phytophthora pseudosyringae TaxID=221518 RepID=A0A8T1WG12_9STRA|nr:hypothetical protein PHYPSEUDO_002345 [Phytophthora pseudosyringae]